MNTLEIEKKWQKRWEENHVFEAKDDFTKKKFYGLVEFPYPSGAGMHVGHIKAYSSLEVISRKKRMEGYNVLFPIGFDAFGLPTENYAVKTNTHPRIVTDNNIKRFTEQLKSVGFSFDYSRTIDTTDEKYYKWTQWIFMKMFEHGLVFRDNAYVNYCPHCKVVLANEDSQGGKCDICHSDVIQKEKKVWYLRITEYADKLLEGLEKVDYLPNVKLQQQNWIGKSTGAFVDFKLKDLDEKLKIYTTRPDTLFGVTFMVMAPEHPLIDKYSQIITNMNEINEYREFAKKKTEFERTQINKDKTGIKINGISAINPMNNKEIPIYISDYVMMGYGTGAIMAVPAHDERNFEFATKFNIPIIPVIEQITGEKRANETTKNSIVAIVYDEKNDKYLTINWASLGGRLFVGGTIKDGETPIECAKREILEETGYKNIEFINDILPINHHYYAYNKNKAYSIESTGLLFKLIDDEKQEQNLDEDEKNNFTVEWVSKDTIEKEVLDELHITTFHNLLSPNAYTGNGIMVNSEFLNGIDNKNEAIEKVIEFLQEKKIGEKGVQYKMKDWAFNRQRYWGEPIPIIHCETCGDVLVPYEELPLRLPKVENFEPGTDGESPLAKLEEFVNCKCPKCGRDAKRETDTMPQWAGSSWYYLRYIDPNNDNELANMEKLKYWLPVDWYNGGMEHVTRHMIYSRFWHKFLYDIGVVPCDEPYAKRTAQGMILGSDGEKMSKSRGNVVDPLDVINMYGADTLRTYILFMGDYGVECPWNDDAIKGVSRFLERVNKLGEKVIPGDITKDLESQVHKTIKKVSNDIETMKFNTAIAELMKLLNAYYEKDNITESEFEVFIKLLYPFAPHMCEELNESILHKESLVYSSWPTYDEDKTIDSEYKIGVQVNGKLRATIIVSDNDTEDDIKNKTLKEENIQRYIEGKEIIKFIIIPRKIVSVVVK